MRCLVVFAVLTVMAGPAGAEIIHYLGPHPITPKVMRGMCQIEGPHVHDYSPHKPVLYVRAGVAWTFVGDPVEYEAEVPRHAYYGHHPVFWSSPGGEPEPTGHVCYISGPHHHWYAPPPELRFVNRGGAYWYVGGMPRGYVKRWRQRSPMDEHYGSVTLMVPRPVVTIAPPEGYVGVYFGPGRRRHYYGGGVGVGVTGPDVEVHLPAPPSLNISIGGGGGGVIYGGGGVVYGGRKVRGGPPPHAPAWGARGYKGHGGGKGGHGKGKGKWK